MTEGSPVKENQCDERRKDIYNKIDEMEEDINKMKGGIAVFKWVIPGMIAVCGVWADRKIDELKKEVKKRPAVVIESRTGAPHSVKWNEKTGKFESVTEPAETLEVKE